MAQTMPKATRKNAMAFARHVETYVLSAWAYDPAVNIGDLGGLVCLAIEFIPFSIFNNVVIIKDYPP